ncbi:MAG: DUF1850 domain-containing protein [Flavobacteriaceae bacterium]
MIGACIASGGKLAALATTVFTLSWTHSVERTEWRERWHASEAGLTLIEARVKGSGAGMEPGEGAVLSDGWWIWKPSGPPVPSIVLASSGATGSGWSLCYEQGSECMILGAIAAAPITITACETTEKR